MQGTVLLGNHCYSANFASLGVFIKEYSPGSLLFFRLNQANTNILCLRAPKNAKAVCCDTMAIVKSPLKSLGGDQAVSGGALFKSTGLRKLPCLRSWVKNAQKCNLTKTKKKSTFACTLAKLVIGRFSVTISLSCLKKVEITVRK